MSSPTAMSDFSIFSSDPQGTPNTLPADSASYFARKKASRRRWPLSPHHPPHTCQGWGDLALVQPEAPSETHTLPVQKSWHHPRAWPFSYKTQLNCHTRDTDRRST